VERRGGNWGWIGLLGLVGLFGLRRREVTEARRVDNRQATPAMR
jgi:MYXO-CTERM domain-containing protein